MTALSDFLAENPAAMAEFEAKLNSAKTAEYERGKQEAQGSVAARVKKAQPYLTADYPDSIKVLAADVVAGESEASALVAAVAAVDAVIGQQNANVAADESDESGPVPPTTELTNDQQLMAESNEILASMGRAQVPVREEVC